MPYTPFHLGPGLMFGLIFSSYFDIPTLIVASLAPDIESFIGIVLQLSYPWFGWFHSLPGSIVAVIVVTVAMYALSYTTLFKQKSSFQKILLSSIFGVYFHLLLDFPIHSLLDAGVPQVEVSALFIPFSIPITPIGLAIYSFCIISFPVSYIIYKRR